MTSALAASRPHRGQLTDRPFEGGRKRCEGGGGEEGGGGGGGGGGGEEPTTKSMHFDILSMKSMGGRMSRSELKLGGVVAHSTEMICRR